MFAYTRRHRYQPSTTRTYNARPVEESAKRTSNTRRQSPRRNPAAYKVSPTRTSFAGMHGRTPTALPGSSSPRTSAGAVVIGFPPSVVLVGLGALGGKPGVPGHHRESSGHEALRCGGP